MVSIKSSKLTVAMSIAMITAGSGLLGTAFRAESAAGPTELIVKADAGDVAAQRALGETYLTGRGVTVNPVEGVRYLQLAAMANDAGAHYLLGRHFESVPNASAEDRQRANQHYQRASLMGHSTAQTRYAHIMLDYATSPGLPSADAAIYRQQALMLLENAAKSGNGHAELALGDLKMAGEVVPLDSPGAEALYRAAIEHGQTLGAWRLAQHAGATSLEAVGYVKAAATGGVPEAMHDLALRYEFGRGVPRNLEAAKRWIDAAVKADAPDATRDALRIIAAYSSELQQKQISATTDRLAAVEDQANDARAKLDTTQSALAQRDADFEEINNQLTETALQNTELKTENDRLAAELERRDVDERAQRDEIARLTKSLQAAQSELVAISEEVARHRATIAALRQEPPRIDATKIVSRSAPNAPKPVPTALAAAPAKAPEPEAKPADPRELNQRGLAALRAGRNEEAANLLALASAAGDPIALNNMGLLYTRGIGVAKDVGKAIALFTDAVEKGNAAAANNLGYIYEHGVGGIQMNRDRAIRWYERGMIMGNRSSAEQLMILRRNGIAANG